MTVKTILSIISLGLLIWLFADNALQLDLAATMNNGLTNMKKMEVDQFQNIDSVKAYAKASLDIQRNNTKRNSQIATKRLWIILGLIILQLFLWPKFKKSER